MRIFIASLMYLFVIKATFAKDNQLRLDGSSTVFPIAEAIAEEFGKENPKVRVTVGTSGTGGGFKKFTAGDIDICNASRQIKEGEEKEAKNKNINFIELPIAIDGLAVVVHPTNKFLESITKDQLKKLWEPNSTIKLWSDLDPKFPKEKISFFGPGPDSGTFDYFTEEVVGKARSSRTDYTASEDDNVLIKGIAGSKYSIGYFGHGYYVENKSKVKAVKLDWGKGPIEGNDDTIKSGAYGLSRPLFIYVNAESAKKPEVDSFVKFFLNNASKMAHETGYLPLQEKDSKAALEKYTKKILGKSSIAHKK